MNNNKKPKQNTNLEEKQTFYSTRINFVIIKKILKNKN